MRGARARASVGNVGYFGGQLNSLDPVCLFFKHTFFSFIQLYSQHSQQTPQSLVFIGSARRPRRAKTIANLRPTATNTPKVVTSCNKRAYIVVLWAEITYTLFCVQPTRKVLYETVFY
jgi:hypothetical protein